MKHVRELILWCLLVLFCVSAAGCNTLKGAGKDIEKAGEAIQDAVD